MIYFVRHGQTDYNLKQIYAGQKDIPLNQNGILQAQATANELKDVHFDICYCSPLIRAKQTCAEIVKFHPNLKVIYDDRLKERDYGKLVDLPVGSIKFNRWKVGVDDIATQNYCIEPIMTMYSRIKEFYDQILQENLHKDILIVAHSGIGRIGSAYFYGMPDNKDFSTIRIPNAGVVKFSN
jgi:probable phosphoglycerate mutase